MEGSPDRVRDPEGQRTFHCSLSVCLSPHVFLTQVVLGWIFLHNNQVRLCKKRTVQEAERGMKSRPPSASSAVHPAWGFTHPEDGVPFLVW